MRASVVTERDLEEPERGPVREHVDPFFVALRQPQSLGRQGVRDIDLATKGRNQRIRTQIHLAHPFMEHIGRHVEAIARACTAERGP